MQRLKRGEQPGESCGGSLKDGSCAGSAGGGEEGQRGERLERREPWHGLYIVCDDGETRSQRSESQFSIKCIGMNDHPGNFGGSQKKKEKKLQNSAM